MCILKKKRRNQLRGIGSRVTEEKVFLLLVTPSAPRRIAAVQHPTSQPAQARECSSENNS